MGEEILVEPWRTGGGLYCYEREEESHAKSSAGVPQPGFRLISSLNVSFHAIIMQGQSCVTSVPTLCNLSLELEFLLLNRQSYLYDLLLETVVRCMIIPIMLPYYRKRGAQRSGNFDRRGQ